MERKIGPRVDRPNPPAAAAAAVEPNEAPASSHSATTNADFFEPPVQGPGPEPALDPYDLSRLLNTLGTDTVSRTTTKELLSGEGWKVEQLKMLTPKTLQELHGILLEQQQKHARSLLDPASWLASAKAAVTGSDPTLEQVMAGAQKNLADAVDQKVQAAQTVLQLLRKSTLTDEENAELSRLSGIAYFGYPFLRTPTAPAKSLFLSTEGNYNTAFHQAAKFGNAEALKALLDFDTYLVGTQVRGQTPLDLAARSKNPQVASLLLPYTHPDTMLLDRNTPLHYAAELNLPEIDALAPKASNPNSWNSEGSTPLHLAVARGSTKAIDALLQHPKINPNMFNRQLDSPAALAAKLGQAETLSSLMRVPGFDPNAKSGGKTLLGIAISHGHNNVVEQLLADPRTDPNVAQNDDKFPREPITPLMSAIIHGRDGALDQLLADPRTNISLAAPARKYLPLHAAATYGTPHAIKALLAQPGVDVNAKSTYSDAPIHLAAIRGKGGPEAISALVQAGADLSAKDFNGRTPLDRSVNSKDFLPENVWQLVLAGARLSESSGLQEMLYRIIARRLRRRLETLTPESDDLRSALPAEVRGIIADYTDGGLGPSRAVAAAMSGDVDALNRQHAHDLARRDLTMGLTPLDIAVQKNDADMLRALLERGVPIAPERTHPFTPRTDVMTPLMRAVQAGAADLVQMLLDHGAPTDDTYQGKQALDFMRDAWILPSESLVIKNALAAAQARQQDQIEQHSQAGLSSLDPSQRPTPERLRELRLAALSKRSQG